MVARYPLTFVAVLALAPASFAQQPDHTRTEDVIYGRREGLALTLDVFAPKKPNGAGIIICVSGDFKSGKEMLNGVGPFVLPEFLKRGYVVFAVTHGSQPRFTVPEIVEDVHRAVRFIKASAKKYDVDPEKLGMAGASSGGHLSLMMGCACKPAIPDAKDPIERQSSKVAAVACFFPPTDFLEFDKPNLDRKWEAYRALFDVREFDPKTNKLERVTAERRTELGRTYSPLHCATKGAAPTFIIHGDKDELVPLQQSRDLIARLKECDVICELDVKPGMGHSAFEALTHLPQIANWFDKHLLGRK
jgi:acetyl esterase/lipase